MTAMNRRTLMLLAAAAMASAIAACGKRNASDSAEDEQGAPDVEGALAALAVELFPHDQVPKEKYEGVAAYFAVHSPDVAQAIAAQLNEPGASFTDVDRARRIELVQNNLYSPEFLAFRLTAAVGLYDDLDVVSDFGFQGPSLTEGGYLHRGFNDLDWLPEPQ